MAIAGILVTLLGFLLSVLSLGLSSSLGARLGLVLFGIALSLAGIIGFINRAYLRDAIWKRAIRQICRKPQKRGAGQYANGQFAAAFARGHSVESLP